MEEGSPSKEPSKLLKLSNLLLIWSRQSAAITGARSRRPSVCRPVRIWSGRGRVAIGPSASWVTLALLIAAAGCGGATAPCPTPTTELDQLRGESERLELDLDRAIREERAVAARRDEAARRVEAAQAALDSIAQAKDR